MRHSTKILISLFLLLSLLATPTLVFAVNTVFDVPTISNDFNPNNMVYKSANLNIMAEKWSYGLTANIINTSDLDTLIAELNANVSTSGYSRSILGIYPDGANLSDANAAAIANAGWTEVDLYYEYFLVAGSTPSSGMTPIVEKTSNDDILFLLGNAQYTDDVAIIQVSGINMSWANFSLYETSFNFLKTGSPYGYKYISDVKKFVPLQNCYYGTYGPHIVEILGLEEAESDVNGTYVVVNNALPAELVVDASELPALRENLQQTVIETVPADNTTISTEKDTVVTETIPTTEEPDILLSEQETESATQNTLILKNENHSVEWKFDGAETPSNFTADATVTPINDTDISVDFAYSGELPENTEVTIYISGSEHSYHDGDTLYLYYCNPETNRREYVDESIYQDGQVIFKLQHCSEYIITSVNHGDAYALSTSKSSTTMAPYFILCGVVLIGVFGTNLMLKKRNSN